MLDTRWSARIDAVKPLGKRPREILQALNKLQEEFDLTSDLSNKVSSLTKWLQSLEFVLLATFWFKTAKRKSLKPRDKRWRANQPRDKRWRANQPRGRKWRANQPRGRRLSFICYAMKLEVGDLVWMQSYGYICDKLLRIKNKGKVEVEPKAKRKKWRAN